MNLGSATYSANTTVANWRKNKSTHKYATRMLIYNSVEENITGKSFLFAYGSF